MASDYNYTRGNSAPKSQDKNQSQNSLEQYQFLNGAQVQNDKRGVKVYVFNDESNTNEEDDETTEFELRPRHKKSPFGNQPTESDKLLYFEKEIQEGETLQAIALKYACPVSELKRINNLIQDQEFFALKVVKVPMKKHGVLSEQYVVKEYGSPQNSEVLLEGAAAGFHSDQDSVGDLCDEDSQHDFSDPETQMKVMRTLSIRDNMTSQGQEAEKFLKKMDADLKQFKNSRRLQRESLTEVISVLTNKSIHPLYSNRRSNKNNGADCGITFRNLILMIVTVTILVPLIFFIYYYFLKS